jgi:hypothetical protein
VPRCFAPCRAAGNALVRTASQVTTALMVTAAFVAWPLLAWRDRIKGVEPPRD